MVILILSERNKESEAIASKFMFRLGRLVWFSPIRSTKDYVFELLEECSFGDKSGIVIWSDSGKVNGFGYRIFGKDSKKFSSIGIPFFHLNE